MRSADDVERVGGNEVSGGTEIDGAAGGAEARHECSEDGRPRGGACSGSDPPWPWQPCSSA